MSVSKRVRRKNGPPGHTDGLNRLVEDALQILLSESGALNICSRSDVFLHLHSLGIADRFHPTV